MDLQEYRQASREQWQGSAENWHRHADHVDGTAAPMTAWMLDAAAIRPGETVLELACGPAGVGLAAAAQVGDRGRVISSDFAEAMVDAAQRRAAALGITNMDFKVLDAESLDLDDESVDVVLCRFGFMLMGDPATAFAGVRRVMRPGGRLALAVWSGADANPWLSLPIQAVQEELGAPPPEPGTPGVFALSDADRLRSMLEDAGLSDVRVERVSSGNPFDSFEDYWRTTTDLAAPLRNLLANLPDDGRDRIMQRVRQGATNFTRDDGRVEWPSEALGAVAAR